MRSFVDSSGIVRLQGTEPAQAQSFDLSPSPVTFANYRLTDFGRLTPASVTFALADFDGDGETYGNGAGEIQAALVLEANVAAAFTNDCGESPDGVSWYSTAQLVAAAPSYTFLYSADATMVCVGVFLRYFGAGAIIYDNDTSDVYAGANNPTVSIAVTIESD